MPFIKNINNDFSIKDNRIVLSKNYFDNYHNRFAKITGTRFSCILGQNKFSSPFKTWAIMTKIYKEEMDPTLSKVGCAIEPKVREYVEKELGCKYLSYDPIQIRFDVFHENKIFGGIPDGEPVVNGHIDYSKFPMLEIKTTSIDSFVYKKENGSFLMKKDENGYPLIKLPGEKRNSWYCDNDIVISEEYKYQLGLYLYLRNIDKGIFAVTFLTGEDYVHPENYVANEHEIALVNFSINDLDHFKQKVEYAKQWYIDHIQTGISPKMTAEDKKWLKEELGQVF
uniref:YqaJ viral recombinase domain-containing protein n=1 Tax=uncultured Mycoplasmataceae bacterium TaxID=300027 RepID=A0A6G9HHR7_9MOLU|nr:hypothetical protein PlMoll_0630 [uncultured Mycoplasmataceae bacterium]